MNDYYYFRPVTEEEHTTVLNETTDKGKVIARRKNKYSSLIKGVNSNYVPAQGRATAMRTLNPAPYRGHTWRKAKEQSNRLPVASCATLAQKINELVHGLPEDWHPSTHPIPMDWWTTKTAEERYDMYFKIRWAR